MENIHITNTEYLEVYKIDIKFNTGFSQVLDLRDEICGEIFEPLKDIEYFRNFKLNPFTIYWENGADFSPEYLFEMAQKRNLCLPIKSEIRINLTRNSEVGQTVFDQIQLRLKSHYFTYTIPMIF